MLLLIIILMLQYFFTVFLLNFKFTHDLLRWVAKLLKEVGLPEGRRWALMGSTVSTVESSSSSSSSSSLVTKSRAFETKVSGD